MKTVKDIDSEINNILRSLNKNSGKSETDKAKRDVVFLRQIKRYLETEPRPEFITSEIKSIERRLELIPGHYSDWQVGKVLAKYSNPYNSFLTEMGFSTLKTQLKTLKYILD